MSGVSLSVSRPAGRALLIGSDGCRAEPHTVLQQLGFQCAELDDPYAAMVELHRRPLVYWALVLSLNSLYREELQIISAVKKRWPHVEVWLTHTEGRAAALAEAMRLGADGLLLEDGFHRAAVSTSATTESPAILRSHAPPPAPLSSAAVKPVRAANPPPSVDSFAHGPSTDGPLIAGPLIEFSDHDDVTGEPILTADELRALLQDSPAMESAVPDGNI